MSKSTVAGSADGTLLLLLGLNLLLLAFFIMLNSMSTHGARHAREVLAKMQEGYIGEASPSALPGMNKIIWKQTVVNQVQGVILNRLNLNTLPLETDASRVEIVLPATALFSGNALVDEGRSVGQIATAAGAESEVVWSLEGPQADIAQTAARVAALATVAGHVQVRVGAAEQVRVLITPGQTTSPDVGAQLQNAGSAAGSQVRGLQ